MKGAERGQNQLHFPQVPQTVPTTKGVAQRLSSLSRNPSDIMISVLYPNNVGVSGKSTNQVGVHVDPAANSGIGINDDGNRRSAGKLPEVRH